MPRPPRRAIALEYDGANAPRVAALGHDALAEQIIALAREHGVPLVENRELAGLLTQLELGDEIPEMLYLCIAQIIAFAYRLRGWMPEGWEPPATDESGDAAESALS
jgi:flagellar biosynthesis protein